MINICPEGSSKARGRSVAIACYSTIALSGVIIGLTLSIAQGIECGAGYLALAGVSATSAVLVKQLQLMRDISASASMLQQENEKLSLANCRHTELNGRLQQANTKLEAITVHLQEEIDAVLECVQLAGKNSHDFMEELMRIHSKIKHENSIHSELNNQQARFQLLQLFRHFDRNSDFALSLEEMEGSITFLQSVFPNFDMERLRDKLHTSSVSFDDMLHFLATDG